MYQVKLNRDELLLLDGKVNDNVQTTINQVKELDSLDFLGKYKDKPPVYEFFMKLIERIRKPEEVRYQSTWLTYCRLCGKIGGYVKYKSGRNKGQDNLKRPTGFNGFDIGPNFVHMRGHASNGGCSDCEQLIYDDIVKVIELMPCENNIQKPPIYQLMKIATCTKCGWVGTTNDMTPELVIMGNGYYPKGCPKCEATNMLFNSQIETKGNILMKITDVRQQYRKYKL